MIARLLHGFTDRHHSSYTCCGRTWERLGEHRRFVHQEQLATVPCFCGAPAVGWIYDVMSDGQCIDGEAKCQDHMEPQT